MKKRKLLYSLFAVPAACVAPIVLLNTSCSTYSSLIDQQLKNESVKWYNQLTSKPFAKDNLYCESETQGINLYAIHWGYFWNDALHHQEQPTNYIYKNLEIRGQDWKYVQLGLDKSIFPENKTVYHGVEYQEDEFYDQLKNFITQNPDGTYDYSKCVGQTITSYGFISTTLDLSTALKYSNGWVFDNQTANLDGIEIETSPAVLSTTPDSENSDTTTEKYYLPLKEKAMFQINIPKGYKGAAYLADFEFNGQINYDNQVLIHKDCKFKINKIEKNKDDINIFYVDLIDDQQQNTPTETQPK